MVNFKKWVFFLAKKSRFLVQKSNFCHIFAKVIGKKQKRSLKKKKHKEREEVEQGNGEEGK